MTFAEQAEKIIKRMNERGRVTAAATNMTDMNMSDKALKFATTAHNGQTRNDGVTPYIKHCEAVWAKINFAGGDMNMQAAALLHDTMEDCDVSYDTLKEEFNEEVANLVREVTNTWDDQIRFEYKAMLTYKHVFQMSDRAACIKLADRIHNLSDMKDYAIERKIRYLSNSLLIKQALTHRPKDCVLASLWVDFESAIRDVVSNVVYGT